MLSLKVTYKKDEIIWCIKANTFFYEGRENTLQVLLHYGANIEASDYSVKEGNLL